jgi:hypothetical protein
MFTVRALQSAKRSCLNFLNLGRTWKQKLSGDPRFVIFRDLLVPNFFRGNAVDTIRIGGGVTLANASPKGKDFME